MYDEVFQEERQQEMQRFFLKLAQKGEIRSFKKGSPVSYHSRQEFGILLKGKVGIHVHSKEGTRKELFYLRPGEIFGEEGYLEGGNQEIDGYCYEATDIAFVSFQTLNEQEDLNNIKDQFYHSLFRKYQILKHQLVNLVFRDVTTNICQTLLRIGAQSKEGEDLIIRETHQHLADLIGCSRISVTKVLSQLKNKGIIKSEKKFIQIMDPDALDAFGPEDMDMGEFEREEYKKK